MNMNKPLRNMNLLKMGDKGLVTPIVQSQSILFLNFNI